MSKEKRLFESYQKLIAGTDIPIEDERAIIEEIARTDPQSLPTLCALFASQRRRLQAELEKVQEARQQAEHSLAQLRQPPWYPGEVLHVYDDGHLDVIVAGRRQVVVAVPELAGVPLQSGDEVFLDRELSLAVRRNDARRLVGAVGTVAATHGERIVVRGSGEDEIVATAARDLAASVRVGDRVLYRRESQCVIARLPERTQSAYVLQQPPRVRFSDIGGLDDVGVEIRRDLDLHLLHPELVSRYQLRQMRGITLVGPPGNGKTMLAAAIATYLNETCPDTGFLHVKPGALRGMYYGESESRIRELFAVARRAPGLVVIFFDELDTFGTRGAGIGQEIDGRVMGALLAEIDGLDPSDRILCIGATNRLDLCDEALVREGRLKDRIYQVRRPGRDAACQIFARYVTPDLPYASGTDGESCARAVIEAALGHLYAPRGGAGPIATVTLMNGTRHELMPPAVLSGALIASAVERAKHAAADRSINGEGGLAVEDVLAALDAALTAEAGKIRAPHAARRILDFPGSDDIVHVELPAHRTARRYRYLRAA